MGIVQRQSLRNTVITYLGTALGFLNAILLFPRFLAPDELGLVNLLPLLATIYAQLSSVGLPGTIIRFFPYFRDKRRAHHGFPFMVLAVSLAGFVAATVLYFLIRPLVVSIYREQSGLLVDFYLYIVPLALISLWHLLLENYSNALFKTVIPSLVRSILLRLGNTLIISLVAFGWIGFKTFVVLFILNNLAAALVLVVYLGYLRQLHFRPRWTFRFKMLTRRMATYAAGVLFFSVSATAYRLIDSLMLAAFVDLTAVGIYTTMIFILEMMLVPWRSMQKIVYPLVGEHWKNREVDRIAVLYRQVSIVNIIFGGFVFLLIAVNLDSILGLLPERFEAGRNVIFILGLARMFDLATGINHVIVITSRYYVMSIVFLLLLTVLAVVSNYLLIPLYGINGAALAITLSMLVLNTIQVLFVRWRFGMQPFSARTPLALALIGVLIVGGMFLPGLSFWPLDVLYRSVVCGVAYWGLVLRLRISEEVREYLARNLSRVGLGGLVRRFS